VLAEAFVGKYLAAATTPPRLSSLIHACQQLQCRVETAPLGAESGRTYRAGAEWRIQLAEGQNYRRQRFTLAHEVGHLLLRTNQLSCPEEERFCDDFAAELLLPREAVLAAARNRRQDLATARDISDQFQVTLSSAVVRLNRVAGWSAAILTFWRQDDTWMLYSTLGAPKEQRFLIRSGSQCTQLLTGMRPGRAHLSVPLPLKINDVEVAVNCSIWRTKHYATVLIDRASLR
jgi:hypothetical protein